MNPFLINIQKLSILLFSVVRRYSTRTWKCTSEFTQQRNEWTDRYTLWSLLFKVNGYICKFWLPFFGGGGAIFGNVVVSLISNSILKWELLLVERNYSKKEQILSFKSSSICNGRQIWLGMVSIPIYLEILQFLFHMWYNQTHKPFYNIHYNSVLNSKNI